MVVLQSDHLVVNESKFLDTVNAAYEFVKNKDNAVITLEIIKLITTPQTAIIKT